MIEIFKSSILAGMFISLGCIVNLTVGGYLGAILFSFGLLSVVHYKLKLYTLLRMYRLIVLLMLPLQFLKKDWLYHGMTVYC